MSYGDFSRSCLGNFTRLEAVCPWGDVSVCTSSLISVLHHAPSVLGWPCLSQVIFLTQGHLLLVVCSSLCLKIHRSLGRKSLELNCLLQFLNEEFYPFTKELSALLQAGTALLSWSPLPFLSWYLRRRLNAICYFFLMAREEIMN